jgi:flagellin
LPNGSTSSITLQIGANNGDTLAVALTDNTATTLAVGTNNITTQATASAPITALDAVINIVIISPLNVGLLRDRLDVVSRSFAIVSEQIASATSRFADTDITSGTSELIRIHNFQQAGTSVLPEFDPEAQWRNRFEKLRPNIQQTQTSFDNLQRGA